MLAGLTLVAEDVALTHRVLAAVGASARRYASDMVDFQFLDLDDPRRPTSSVADTA